MTQTQPQAPMFNLKAGNLGFKSDADLQKKLDEPQGKGFQPGNYDLQIIAAEFHANKETGSIYCAGDDSWLNVVITCAGTEDRTTKYYVQVPTNNVYFKGAKGKPTLFVFRKFTEFMAAIGVPVTLETLDKVVPKYFSTPSKALTGLKFNADIGFDGPYIEKVSDTECRIIKNGKALEDESGVVTFPDFQSARAYADGARIKTSRPSIVKFTAVKSATTTTAAAPDTDW